MNQESETRFFKVELRFEIDMKVPGSEEQEALENAIEEFRDIFILEGMEEFLTPYGHETTEIPRDEARESGFFEAYFEDEEEPS